MKILSLFAALLLAATGAAHAQNIFTIQSKGAAVGKCSYSFDKSKDGYKIFSRYQARIQGKPAADDPTDINAESKAITDLQQAHEYKLDAAYSYLGGSIVDSVNQIDSGYSPNKDRTILQMTTRQAGTQSSPMQLALMPGLFVLPDYDASAVQGLLYLAVTHPTPNNIYFLVVPGQHGPQSVQSHWVAQPDATGTLAGKPVTLHHYAFSFGKHIYNVYADGTNTLMETDISGLKISYIRNGFALDAATAAAAPATAPAAK